MKEQEKDAAFLAGVRENLDRDAEGMDAATLSRLRRIREAALEEGAPAGRPFRWLLPASGLALAGALALAILFGTERGPGRLPSVAENDDVEYMEILASDDGMDLYEELDFYAWLSENNQDAG